VTRFEVFTTLDNPGLHVWKPATQLDVFLRPAGERLPSGAWRFRCQLGRTPLEKVCCQIFEWGRGEEKKNWEAGHYIKTLPRGEGNALPRTVYLFHGAARAAAENPFASTHDEVTIHLVTAARYQSARLFLWGPTLAQPRWVDKEAIPGAQFPSWKVPLSGASRSAFLFKFFRPVGDGWEPEGDFSNRLWISQDGADVWAHSEARDVLRVEPVKQPLRVFFRQEAVQPELAVMHVWGPGSDFAADARASAASEGWSSHEIPLYTGLPYRFKFRQRDVWEDDEARRDIVIDGAGERWTLAGDCHLFAAEPQRNARIELVVAAPSAEISDVRVNHAPSPLATNLGLAFDTYPDVVTSFRFKDIDVRHYLRGKAGQTLKAFVVPGRPPILSAPPLPDLFTDPPFFIKRPGAYEEDGHIRFVLHAPWCARVDVQGEWMPAGMALPMRSTKDGAYWWAQMPVPASDYHGLRYRFQFNGDANDTVQDPAAGWVDGSSPEGWSKLLQSGRYAWRSNSWRTPSADWLNLYQLHPARFTSRGPDGSPLSKTAWEVADHSGHLRNLGVTAIQLMPVNEVGTSNSWGYDPAFYYAVEASYGGPDALKAFIDTCHENGRAVLFDVIFNHAGTTDNILWKTAQGSFFDGDTAWGAMINYDNAQVIHFFEQNVIYLLEEYRADGIRFDFTRVITRGHIQGEANVRRPGSGGGWEFLHRIRRAMRSVNPDALLIAEHLPNEWDVVNFGGPMDSQWCDDFHDRLKEVCAGQFGDLPGLAAALQLTHTAADNWYKSTNYAESHDEVGNENGRIANVGGLGRGLRMSKVAMCVTLLSRGVPMMFMGAEAGEFRQFQQGASDTLDLGNYSSDVQRRRLRDWTNALLDLRKNNSNLQGPAPLDVRYAQDGQLAFTRGRAGDYFVLANFSSWSGWKRLGELNLPQGLYRERWNSTWPAFQVEWEDEHANGGRDAWLHAGAELHVPDYGAVILERR
jgi:1,4-alpha-glucan branching enzyme